MLWRVLPKPSSTSQTTVDRLTCQYSSTFWLQPPARCSSPYYSYSQLSTKLKRISKKCLNCSHIETLKSTLMTSWRCVETLYRYGYSKPLKVWASMTSTEQITGQLGETKMGEALLEDKGMHREEQIRNCRMISTTTSTWNDWRKRTRAKSGNL